MLSVQALDRQFDRLRTIDKSRAGGHFNPQYPVMQADVEYAQKLHPYLLAQVEKPNPADQQHRERVKDVLEMLYQLYAPQARNLSDAQLRAEAQQAAARAQFMLDALAEYPLWAIQAGLTGYTKSEKGEYPPKVSGQVLPFISLEYGKATASLSRCEAILQNDKRGLNIDRLNDAVNAAKTEEHRANAALSAKNILENNLSNIHAMPEQARAMYDGWCKIWTDWRASGGTRSIPAKPPVPNMSANRATA